MNIIKEGDIIKRHIIGVDPALAGDKSALILLRIVDHVTLRHFQNPLHELRYDLIGTKTLSGSLVHQAGEIEGIIPRFERCTVALDCTGLGIGLENILYASGVYAKKIVITGGQRANHSGRNLNVPRTVLIECLQRIIQQQKLKILKSQYSDLLLRELESFRSVYTSDGKLRFEADISRSLSHADFSFATACAVYVAENTGECVAVGWPG